MGGAWGGEWVEPGVESGWSLGRRVGGAWGGEWVEPEDEAKI